MSTEMRCGRCDELFKPIDLSKDWPTRLQGRVTIQTYKVGWTSIYFGNIPALERPKFLNTEMTMCDECWASLLAWATQPGQERARIAAENRLAKKRLVDAAEERREREVKRWMDEKS